MLSANRVTLPCMRSEARKVPLRSICRLRRRIYGPAWSSFSVELRSSQVSPEANLLLASGLLKSSRGHHQLGKPLEMVSYQTGFRPRDRPWVVTVVLHQLRKAARICLHAHEVIQLGVLVEAGAGRNKANPVGTRVHEDQEISGC